MADHTTSTVVRAPRLVDGWCSLYCAHMFAVDRLLRSADEDEIRATISFVETHEPNPPPELVSRLRAELLFREHDRRAAACGEDVYCVFHACGESKCPPHEHPERDMPGDLYEAVATTERLKAEGS